MEDSTPGSTENQNPDANQASPDTTQQTPADNGSDTTSSTDTTQGTGDDTPHVDDSANDNDKGDGASQQNDADEIADWAKKQGIDLDNPTPEQAKTLAKRVIDNQRAYHQAQSQLKAADTVSSGAVEAMSDPDGSDGPTQADIELYSLRTERFFTRNPEAEEFAGAMSDYLQKESETYGPESAKILANNLPRLLTLVKAESASTDASASYDKGRQDERQNLAKSQQAGAPPMSASSSAPQSTTVTDKAVGEMSVPEYAEWRKTHNPWDVPVK